MQERKTERYRKRLAELQNIVESQFWREHWRELADYFLPRRGRYLTSPNTNEDNKGDKRNRKIINGSSYDAVRTLAAGMQGGLTSPSRPWFRLSLADEELAGYAPVKRHLHDIRTVMLNVFQRSNFYGAIHSVYEELAVFGTAPLGIYEDFDTVVRFRPYTAGEYYLAAAPNFSIDTMYRRYSLTARQLVEEFGEENVSDEVKNIYKENGGEKRFSVINAIQPNRLRDPASLGTSRFPFESITFEEHGRGENFLRTGGYESLPFVAPRWYLAATDVYGRSPGMSALGDNKMLQKMETKKLKALDKMIDPPMNAPTTMRKNGNPNTLPGGVTFVDTQQGMQGFTPTYQINPDIRMFEESIDRVEVRQRRFFFNDMFQMILGQEKTMTAREVSERHEEKLMMLGPVLERLQSEMLGPIIARTYEVMNNLGMIPEAPPEMQGAAINVEYVSLLAQAQRMVSAPIVEQFVGFTGNLAGVEPTVLDKIDFDQAIDEYGNMLGVPPEVIRSDEEVTAIREAREAAAAQKRQQEAMAQGVQGAKLLSETDVGGQNALEALTGV